LHFSDVKDNKRTYREMSISVNFSSDSDKKLINNYPVELAALVFSEKTENLKIEWK
jgi:hypothetical protein